MKKEKKSHFNLWIYVIITICILSSSIAYSALNASVKITGDVVIKKLIEGDLYKKVKEGAVMDNIKSTYVSSSTGINFKEISSNTNGKGVYERKGTENNPYPIYYYRGEVDNNNVLFANYCWKIVRTTETGGVKIIYSGKPSTDGKSCIAAPSFNYSLPFNTSDNSPAYVGYKYGTVYPVTRETTLSGGVYGSNVSYSGGKYTLQTTSSTLDNTHHYSCGGTTSCSSVRFYTYKASLYYDYITLSGGVKIEDALANMLDKNETNSTIKDYVENTWYKGHMTSYSDRLEDTEWCNDRSIYQKGGWDAQGQLDRLDSPGLVFGGEERLRNGSPNLTCPRETDKLTVANGGVQYKTGLLTVDEAMLAGVSRDDDNENTYLYFASAFSIWLMSPGVVFGIATEEDIWNSSTIDADGVSNNLAVYPVVSLKSDTSITGGNGTAGSPYIID